MGKELYEKADYVIEEQSDGKWIMVKNRYGQQGERIYNPMNWLSEYDNTVLIYKDGQIRTYMN